jgi:hypothetical protein
MLSREKNGARREMATKNRLAIIDAFVMPVTPRFRSICRMTGP